jgi:hypothetical protein
VKRDQLSPHAPELTDERERTAPTETEIRTTITSLVTYLLDERERQGMQYQQFERASGLAKGSMSNIKGRKSCSFEAFLAMCHGLGKKPSEVAAIFLDRPQHGATLAHGGTVPIVVQSGVSTETVQHAAREAAAVEAKRSVVSTKPGRSDTKLTVSKKNSHR